MDKRPGWYPDPDHPQLLRRWDGSTWSGLSRPDDGETRIGPDRMAKTLRWWGYLLLVAITFLVSGMVWFFCFLVGLALSIPDDPPPPDAWQTFVAHHWLVLPLLVSALVIQIGLITFDLKSKFFGTLIGLCCGYVIPLVVGFTIFYIIQPNAHM